MICKYFLPFWRLPFHFLDVVLCSTLVLNFDEVQLICFHFGWLCFLVSYLRTTARLILSLRPASCPYVVLYMVIYLRLFLGS